jgi:hypothetical protein
MGILGWLFGKKEVYEKMPDFRRLFDLMENVIDAKKAEPKEKEIPNLTALQDLAAAKNVAEQETKAAASKEKINGVYERIQTAKGRNLEIIWLLQANKDFPCKSLTELIENYHNLKDSDSHGRMSVNYASHGKLYEISSLSEQDLAGLAKKLESGKKVNSGAR